MLEIFGRGICWFIIFGSVLMSVEDVNNPNQIPGYDMPCGYIGSH